MGTVRKEEKKLQRGGEEREELMGIGWKKGRTLKEYKMGKVKGKTEGEREKKG